MTDEWSAMRKRQDGFTILETLVTATIFGVLTAIAIPNISSSLTAHQMTAGLRRTVGVIRVARSVAISRNQQARISRSNGNKTLTVETAPNGGSTWTSVGTPIVLDGVSVSSLSPSSGILFDNKGTLGTVTNGVTVTVQSTSGATKTISIGLLGGVEIS